MTYGGTPVELGRRAHDIPLALVERLAPNDAWTINPYGACDIRCTYCITNAQGRSWPRFDLDEVVPRLRSELSAIGRADRFVVGSFCDGYPGVEAELGITRAVIEELVAQELPFRVVTKGTTVTRDADLLVHAIEVQVSVNTLDEDAVARNEPGAPTAAARLAALHQLADAGVAVHLQASPWIPGVTDIAALRAAVDHAIGITVTPIRLPTTLEPFAERRGLDQASVNDAFHREFDRVGPLDGVRWSRPPPLDGTPPRIELNVGREEPTTWEPAPSDPAPYSPFATARRAAGAREPAGGRLGWRWRSGRARRRP